MNSLQIIEKNNQRVLLTSQLAEQYGTSEKVISNNFNNNKERYIEGKHYYILQGEELVGFLQSSNLGLQNISKIRCLYLWTEKGALLHAKSLNTDRAWQVYDILVDTYFNVREKTIDTSKLSPELQMFKQIFDSVAATQLRQQALEEKIERTNEKVDSIKDVVSLDSTSWRSETQNLLNKMAIKLGGTSQFYQSLKKESYELLDNRLGVSISIRLTNMKKNMALNGVCKSKVDKINKMDVIANDKKLIEGYMAIVKDMAIKYGLAD